MIISLCASARGNPIKRFLLKAIDVAKISIKIQTQMNLLFTFGDNNSEILLTVQVFSIGVQELVQRGDTGVDKKHIIMTKASSIKIFQLVHLATTGYTANLRVADGGYVIVQQGPVFFTLFCVSKVYLYVNLYLFSSFCFSFGTPSTIFICKWYTRVTNISLSSHTDLVLGCLKSRNQFHCTRRSARMPDEGDRC